MKKLFHAIKKINVTWTFRDCVILYFDWLLCFSLLLSLFSSVFFSFFTEQHLIYNMSEKKEKLIRGHRRESALFTLSELQDLRGKIKSNEIKR